MTDPSSSVVGQSVPTKVRASVGRVYERLLTELGQYGNDASEQRRYSPPSKIGITKTPVHGTPDRDRICTSIVERQNFTVRMQMRRFTQ